VDQLLLGCLKPLSEGLHTSCFAFPVYQRLVQNKVYIPAQAYAHVHATILGLAELLLLPVLLAQVDPVWISVFEVSLSMRLNSFSRGCHAWYPFFQHVNSSKS
jgi:hypothetical protein